MNLEGAKIDFIPSLYFHNYVSVVFIVSHVFLFNQSEKIMGFSYKQMYRDLRKKGKFQLKIFAGCVRCHAVMSRRAINKHKDWCK